MRSISYQDMLGWQGTDWLRVRVTTDRGEVLNFTVQYETIVRGERLAVVRYDCAHGFPHVDILDRRGEVVSKEPLLDLPSLGVALTRGIADIRKNWQAYRSRFLGE